MKNKDTQILQQNKILLGGQTINLRARQMIYILAASMNKNKPTEGISIDAKEFLNFINNTSGEKWTDIYSLTNDVFEHLNDNPILIKSPRKKDFIKINWLSRLGVVGGMIEARFSADIADYLLYKQGLPYTKLLWDLRPYKSKYTARIMDLFQRYHDKRKFTPAKNNEKVNDFDFDFDIDELKLFFGVHDSYSRFYDFEKNVLKVAEQELETNDLVPYWFRYEKLKKGRSIKTIRFHVEVRSETLLELLPRLKVRKKANAMQLNINDMIREEEFSTTKKNVFSKLTKELNIPDFFAEPVLHKLSNSQSVAYMYLIEYGVNRSLAFVIVSEQCSFGEILQNEHLYVKYTLDKVEAARLKRIKEAKSGKLKKGVRTTPEDKRGGLVKKVFKDKQHFSAFMEHLPLLRKKEMEKYNKKRGQGVSSVKEIIGKMNSTSSNKKNGGV